MFLIFLPHMGNVDFTLHHGLRLYYYLGSIYLVLIDIYTYLDSY